MNVHGKMLKIWTIRKFKNERTYRKNKPYAVSRFYDNVLLNEGINELWTILCSSGGIKFDNANAYLGVGDSNTAADPIQTGLLGASKTYKGMDAGYPVYGSDQKAGFKALFGSEEGNHAWNEFTVANGNIDAAKNLNRKVSAQGTKAAGKVWELSVDIILS
jgi:hypothetical protein